MCTNIYTANLIYCFHCMDMSLVSQHSSSQCYQLCYHSHIKTTNFIKQGSLIVSTVAQLIHWSTLHFIWSNPHIHNYTSQMVSSLQVFEPKFYMHFSSLQCMLHDPPIPSLFYQPNNIWWRVQFIKLLIIKFSACSYYLLSLRTKYSLQIPFAFFLRVRDQLSHPHKTMG